MLKKQKIYALAAFIALQVIAFAGAAGADKIKIVTSLPDLASIAQEIGGDYVTTFSIAKGYQDPHFVDPKPSYMIRLQKADIFIQVGLDLEIGWIPPLLEGARNGAILPGGKGYIDASVGIPLLEVPTGEPSKLRAEGDIHIYGNPHYWLDPLRGKMIAENIHNGLIRLQPENEAQFRSNLDIFNQKIDALTQNLQDKISDYAGTKVIAFHNSWPYFDERFHFDLVGFIEPKPGIPPSPKHLVSVINHMKQNDIRIIIISPYFSKKSAQLIASKTSAVLIELASSVGAQAEIKSYFDLFEYNINKLIEGIKQAGIIKKNNK
ncbi:MAG: zinc ABC transporter substrate-binding protein [Calditrichaeota bacterium]|nr:MAG: zinc ABC transporter substrate-binding protein [Calditrichota bacterium]